MENKLGKPHKIDDTSRETSLASCIDTSRETLYCGAFVMLISDRAPKPSPDMRGQMCRVHTVSCSNSIAVISSARYRLHRAAKRYHQQYDDGADAIMCELFRCGWFAPRFVVVHLFPLPATVEWSARVPDCPVDGY